MIVFRKYYTDMYYYPDYIGDAKGAVSEFSYDLEKILGAFVIVPGDFNEYIRLNMYKLIPVVR